MQTEEDGAKSHRPLQSGFLLLYDEISSLIYRNCLDFH